MNAFAFALSVIASLLASAFVYPFSAIALFPALSVITFVFGCSYEGHQATERSAGIYVWMLIAASFGLSAVILFVWLNLPEAAAIRFVDALLGASIAIDKAAYLAQIQDLVRPQSVHRYISLSVTLMAAPYIMIAASAPWFLAIFKTSSQRAVVSPIKKFWAALFLVFCLGLLAWWSLYLEAIAPTDGKHPLMYLTYAFKRDLSIHIIWRSGLLTSLWIFVVLSGALTLDSARQAISHRYW